MQPVVWFTLIFQFILGSVLTQLIGMIRTLITTNTTLMLDIKYSATLLVFVGYCIEASNFDLFNGPYWYE